jgi:hypothetical protein
MRRRTRYSLLLMFALVAALLVALYLRQKAPPEVACLLPESDAIVYVNVKPLRLATHFDKTLVTRSADFQRFIDATGVVPERDLDEVAFALHRMDDPKGPNGPVAYSEVFSGRFDGARLGRYLVSIATAKESYAGHDIYTIQVGDAAAGGGRELRVTQLGYDMVAASNMPTAEQIHSMLDRYRAAASPFSGSSLLSARYEDVPLLSSVWGIGHVGLPFSEGGRISVMGLELPLAEDTTFVASLQYRGTVRLRVEEIAPTEKDAARSTEALSTLLALLRSLQRASNDTPRDAAVMQAIESIKIEQHKDRAVLTASIPLDLVKQITTPITQSGRAESAPSGR